MRASRRRCCAFPRLPGLLVVLLLLSLLLVLDPACAKNKKKSNKKKYKVIRHKDGPLKNPSMIARCSACRAVASDLTERLEPFKNKSPSEVQMMEVIEGPDNLGHNLGHLCMAMKVRWHYLTIMQDPERFSEAEIKAFPKRAGEPLAKWVATTEDETWPQEKKELLANRRKLAEYCTTLLERIEDTLIPHVQDRYERAWRQLPTVCCRAVRKCTAQFPQRTGDRIPDVLCNILGVGQ